MASSVLSLCPPPLSAMSDLAQLPQATLRALTPSDFPAWVRLRDDVLAGLAHPDAYVREDDDAAFFARNSSPHGEGIGVFLGDEMVAYGMLGIPGVGDADHLGAVIGLPLDLHAGVAHLASCMVRRPWRANQLQPLLVKLRCALAQAYDRPICLSMVSLNNGASRHNLLAHGMWIAWTGMIDGLRRHVLQLDLLGRQRWDLRDSWLIAGDDFEQLCAAADGGYVGVQEVREGGRSLLRYARRLPDDVPRVDHGVVPW